MLATSLLVVHDTSRGGQDDVAELTRGEELDGPALEVTELNGVAGADDTALVETAVELDDDLAGAVVVDFLEFTNVAFKNQILARLLRRPRGLPNREDPKRRKETFLKISAVV